MSFLFQSEENARKEYEEIRGVKDSDLSKLTDNKLIMLSIARLFEGEGIYDEALIDELYSRGRKI